MISHAPRLRPEGGVMGEAKPSETKIDLDDFDQSHPFYKRIRYNLRAHSKSKIIKPKRWLIPRWLGENDLAVIFGAWEAGKIRFRGGYSLSFGRGS
jgi:hypothetical protein